MVQVRFCMYLESGDYGYERHYVEVPVIPEGGYPGKVDEAGRPVDLVDYQKWIDGLSKTWQNNPFHNHFVYVEPTATDKEILDLAEAYLHEAYTKWATDSKLDLVNHVTFPQSVNTQRKADCIAKADAVKAITEVRKI
jgi:hypothetical protein